MLSILITTFLLQWILYSTPPSGFLACITGEIFAFYRGTETSARGARSATHVKSLRFAGERIMETSARRARSAIHARGEDREK